MTEKSGKKGFSKNRSAPYVLHSPRVREIFTEQSVKTAMISAEHLKDELKSITLRPWKVFQLTPLFGIIYERRKFAEYEKYLLLSFEKEQKNLSTLIGTESDLKVRMSVKNEFRMIRDDPKTIKIEVFKKAKSDKRTFSNNTSENQELLFIGYLTSVERKHERLESGLKDAKAVILPLFLTNGKNFFTTHIIQFLTEKFACIVSPMQFSPLNLGWMASMWAGYKAESGLKPLFLEYTLPMKNINTVQCSIDANAAIEIWDRIHDPSKNEMNSEEVDAFLTSLEKHFKILFATDLSHFQLASIGTSVAAVHRNGKIKIFCNTALPYILRHLTHLAQETSSL